jgi:uncharacterized membrane protein YcaP (DUF421 family)
MFELEVNGLELVSRALLIYFALLVMMRIAGKRDVGQLSIFDLLVVLLIAEGVSSSIQGANESVTGGIIIAAVIMAANRLIAVAGDFIPAVSRFIEGTPTEIVRNGRMLRKNMHKESITEDELMTAIRSHGVDDVRKVQRAVLETDGTISVITEAEKSDKPKRRTAT